MAESSGLSGMRYQKRPWLGCRHAPHTPSISFSFTIAYDPHAMVKENEMDGVWGACLQPSQGLFWYRIPDSPLLSAICRVYNDWIAEFCKPFPDRLKGIAMLNVDDVDEGARELERCAKLGLVGAFIPVSP